MYPLSKSGDANIRYVRYVPITAPEPALPSAKGRLPRITVKLPPTLILCPCVFLTQSLQNAKVIDKLSRGCVLFLISFLTVSTLHVAKKVLCIMLAHCREPTIRQTCPSKKEAKAQRHAQTKPQCNPRDGWIKITNLGQQCRKAKTESPIIGSHLVSVDDQPQSSFLGGTFAQRRAAKEKENSDHRAALLLQLVGDLTQTADNLLFWLALRFRGPRRGFDHNPRHL